MKAPKIITILFVVVLLFTAMQKNNAQNYACPSSTMSYGIGYYSGGTGNCSRMISSAPSVSGGNLISWDPQTATVQWASDFVSGSISASFTMVGGNNPCQLYGTCSVSRIWATSLTISTPYTDMLGGHTYTISSNITHEGSYGNGSPNVTWKMYAGVTPTESNFITNLNSGGNISFKPYDYMQAIQNYFSSVNPPLNYTNPFTVFIQATYTVCGRSIPSNVLPINIQPEPVTNIVFNTKQTTCLNSTDGKLEITQFLLDGGTYNSGTIPGNGVWLRVSAVNAQGGVIGIPYFDAAVTSLPIIADGLPDISSTGASYQFQIERIFTANIKSGIFDQNHPFSITNGPQLSLHLNKTSPNCYNSSLTVDASVFNQNGTQVSGNFNYYLNTGISGSNVNAYTYSIPNAGIYNLQAVSSLNSYCKTNPVPFTNPAEISITKGNVGQPTECYAADGSDTEFGNIAVTVPNYYGTLSFSVTLDGTSYEPEVTGSGNSRTFSELEPGKYNITATHSCVGESASTGIITINPLQRPVVPNGNSVITNATCNGENGSIALTGFSYSGTNYTISSNTDDFSFSIDLNSVGKSQFFNYITTAEDSHAFRIMHNTTRCDLTYEKAITEPYAVSLSTPLKKQSCLDKDNGSITISSADGNTASSIRNYTISPDINDVGIITGSIPGSTVIFDNLSAGNYTITVNDGCSLHPANDSSATISNYSQIIGSITPVPIACHNQTNGQLLVSGSGGAPNYSITLLPDNVSLTNIAANSQRSFPGLNHKTTYQIKIDDANNCTETFAAPAIINPDTIEITSHENAITHVTCWNGSDAIIPVIARGGTGQLSFSLDNTNFTNGSYNNPSYLYTFSGLNAGDKTVYLKDDNNCLISQSYTIDQPAEYIVNNLSTAGAVCYGGTDGSLSVSATGGTSAGGNYTYNLMNAANAQVNSVTAQTATFTGLAFGNYYVNILDSRNCPLRSETKLLSQPIEMTITPAMTSASCYDSENITLTANVNGGTLPYNYTWKDINDNTIGTANSVSVLSGNYRVFVTDANNCGYGRTTVGIVPFPYPFVAQRPDTLKLNIDNQQDVDYNGLSNGSISLVSTGGWSFHQYSIDGINFQNSPLFSGLSIGPYTFHVKDGSNCQNSVTTTIIQPDPFVVSLNSIKDVNCFKGADGQITINTLGGFPPYSFTLDDGNGNKLTQENNVFSNLPSGNYSVKAGYRTYSRTIDNIIVNQPVSSISSNISSSQSPHCNLSDGSASVTAIGGTPPYSYSWNNDQTSTIANNLRSGNYFVIVRDLNNCKDTSQISLYDIDGPKLSIVNIEAPPCYDSKNAGSITISASSGTPPYTIQWNDANKQSGLTATGLTVGNYTATATDTKGCISALGNISISRPNELIIRFDNFKDPVCFNSSNGEITVSATGGTAPFSFEWLNINNAGNTGNVTNLAAGIYNVKLTDNHNCVATGSFELKNPDKIVVNLPDSIFTCEGQMTTLDAGNKGSLYQWSSPSGFSSDKQIVNIQDEGDYSVVVSNVQGCSSSGKVHLKHENRMFYATFLMSSEATMNDTIILVELSRPVPEHVEWYIPNDFVKLIDGDSYKELIPLQTGQFTIGMKGYLSGCSEMIEKTITVIPASDQNSLKNGKDAIIQHVKLFPNPNTGVFDVKVKLAYESDISADLFNAYGIRVIPTKYDYGNKDYLLGFKLKNLEPGIYFINIIAKDEVKKLKFVINY